MHKMTESCSLHTWMWCDSLQALAVYPAAARVPGGFAPAVTACRPWLCAPLQPASLGEGRIVAGERAGLCAFGLPKLRLNVL